jgi:purine-binding chemotaxis protein CheW
VTLLVFRMDGHRFALPLAVVDRVIRAVAVTPLPTAPATVLGVIDLHGHLIPVLSLRRRLGSPDRDIAPADTFVVAHARNRRVALVVDEAEAIVERQPAELVMSSTLTAGVEQFPGLFRLADGLVLLHDLDRFFTAGEDVALHDSLSRQAQPAARPGPGS